MLTGNVLVAAHGTQHSGPICQHSAELRGWGVQALEEGNTGLEDDVAFTRGIGANNQLIDIDKVSVQPVDAVGAGLKVSLPKEVPLVERLNLQCGFRQ